MNKNFEPIEAVEVSFEGSRRAFLKGMSAAGLGAITLQMLETGEVFASETVPESSAATDP